MGLRRAAVRRTRNWHQSIGVGAALEWLSILLATGEEPANEIARDADAIRMVGESVRWIDLAATRNGAADIFDRIPKNVPEERRAKWVENRCITIRAGCEHNHGVAIRHFIKAVIQHRRTVQTGRRVLAGNICRSCG